MDLYLTVDQAAERLHVSATTVRRWIYRGDLKAHKLKTGRNARVLIDLSDLEALLEPMSPRKSTQSFEKRQQAVDRILAFRKQYAGRVDVGSLIDAHRQERDRE